MRRYVWVVGVAVLAVLALFLAGCGGQKGETGQGQISPAQVQPLIDRGGCGGCHVIPGIRGAVGTVGPNLCGVGEEVREGKEDIEDIIREIVDPNADIAPGYQAGIMPTNFGEVFTQEELETIAKYLAQVSCEE